MRKPNFSHYWGKGKPPTLQIRILKSLVLYGKISITRASILLDSNDSDISDAMHKLLQHRKFIEYSDSDTSSRNPEKFYKITEMGLRSLLVVHDLSPEVFWKVVTFLCILNDGQMTQNQFEGHYGQFENGFLGYSTNSHFFLSWLLDEIIQQWLKENSNSLTDINNINNSSAVCISQVVLECLALQRSLTRQQLIKKTGLKEKDLSEILDKYTLPIRFNREKIPIDFISHFLITAKKTSAETTYELTLFGVLLVIAFIRYHYIGIDNIYKSIWDRTKANNRRFSLFYENQKMETYYDEIVYNYKEKLPIIFEKWSLLKSQLGSLLHDGLDFLIYKSARPKIINKSVWFGGNKEFYEDVQSIAQNAYSKLSIVCIQGRGILLHYQDPKYQYKLVPINRKLVELEQELFYANKSYENASQQLDFSTDYINRIEDLFKDEVTFLFYLNLNSSTFSPSINYLSLTPGQLYNININQEIMQLGSPKQRLMAILTKDKDIKQWFSKRLTDITNYRNQISKKMLGFCNEVINPWENIKKEKTTIRKLDNKPELEWLYQEYDIMNICSAIKSPYDY